MELDASAFKDLIEHLKGRKGGTYGLTKDGLTRQSIVDPRLHHLLMKFALVNVSIPFTTVKINGKPPKRCKEYYIVGFGSYMGGELLIDGGAHNIWHRPQIVRESATETPWTGKRWTLTFFAIETTRTLEEYEAIVVDDKWVISQRRQFQPPLYLTAEKRVRNSKEDDADDEEDYDPRFTEAQNLLMNAMTNRASGPSRSTE